jgi:hypothetical protein
MLRLPMSKRFKNNLRMSKKLLEKPKEKKTRPDLIPRLKDSKKLSMMPQKIWMTQPKFAKRSIVNLLKLSKNEKTTEKIKKLTEKVEESKKAVETAEKEAKATIVTLPGGKEEVEKVEKKQEEEKKEEKADTKISTNSVTVT